MTSEVEPQLNKPRRFYKSVSVVAHEAGHAPALDGRLARTPDRAVLAAPTLSLATHLAAEWDAQETHVDMNAMPMVRLAATAIDRAARARAELAEEVARYAGSDLLCYYADAPAELYEREWAAWSPWLDWSAGVLGATLTPAQGVVHQPQSATALGAIRDRAAGENVFTLAGLAFAAPLFGSAVLAYAVREGALDAVAALELSLLDDTFQAERWGLDHEAQARRAALTRDADMIGRWFGALREGG